MSYTPTPPRTIGESESMFNFEIAFATPHYDAATEGVWEITFLDGQSGLYCACHGYTTSQG